MPQPTQNETAELVNLLGRHRLKTAGGHWGCVCGADYGPRTRSYQRAMEVKDEHDFHLARTLLGEGFTLGSKDPREDFLRRATRRVRDTPQA